MLFEPTPKEVVLDELLHGFIDLVDEFDYEKNGVDRTKDFVKYLLFEFYWQATKPNYDSFSKLNKLKKKDAN